MGDAYDATRALLEDRPELEPVVEDIVVLDEDGPWAFDDIDCDSGDFGELVSREFVDSAGDGYRLTDREATRGALEADASTVADNEYTTSVDHEDSRATDGIPDVNLAGALGNLRLGQTLYTLRARTNVDWVFALALAVSLGLVAFVRGLTYDAVFRANHVVPTSNDPFHYRYWVDQLLLESPGILDLSGIGSALGSRASGDPFTYVVAWWATELFGGTQATAGTVVALLPTALAVVTALLAAWMAHAITRDQRVTVLTVVALAITPAHFLYTHVGFYDHHAVDYVWLTGMAAALVWLARDASRRETPAHLRNPLTWAVAGLFGVASGVAMLTWSGAPLLLFAVALYAAVSLPSVIRSGQSPVRLALPLAGGLVFGGVVAGTVHAVGGLQELPAVIAPVLVGVGVLAVALISEGTARLDRSPLVALVGSILLGVGGLVVSWMVIPSVVERFSQRFSEDLLGRTAAAETRGLFVPELSTSFGAFEQFGLLMLFLLPALGYVTWVCVRRHEPAWLVPTSFAWTFLGLATIQRRFAAELSVFAAFFAAVGLIWLASRVSLAHPLESLDGGGRVTLWGEQGSLHVTRVAVFLAILVVLAAASSVTITDAVDVLPAGDEQYEAAQYLDDEIDEPAYVLSQWQDNRLYNYIAWGGGDSYTYAEDVHEKFVQSSDPDLWYGNFSNAEGIGSEHRGKLTSVDYVVIHSGLAQGPIPQTAYGQLSQFAGSGAPEAGIDGVGRFRMTYVTENNTYMVFERVPGAVITGTAEPGAEVAVATSINPRGIQELDYLRLTTADENGNYEVRVAYAGTYRTSTNATAVEVTDADVENGNTVEE